MEPGTRTAVMIRHVIHEDGGTLASHLKGIGWDVQYVEAWTTLERLVYTQCLTADLLVCLGGPISANDEEEFPFLRSEISILQDRIKRDLPTIGICLGAQLLAKAAGGRVFPSRKKEIGWGPLILTAEGLDHPLASLQNISVLHWHGETCSLPENATLLASSELCENQAFTLGRNCLAVQFHPEVTADGLEAWYIAEAKELRGPDAPGVSVMRHAAKRYASALERHSSMLWSGFVIHEF